MFTRFVSTKYRNFSWEDRVAQVSCSITFMSSFLAVGLLGKGRLETMWVNVDDGGFLRFRSLDKIEGLCTSDLGLLWSTPSPHLMLSCFLPSPLALAMVLLTLALTRLDLSLSDFTVVG